MPQCCPDYTTDEIAIVRKGAKDGLTWGQIADMLPGRTERSVETRASRAGIRSILGPRGNGMGRTRLATHEIIEQAVDMLRAHYSPVCAVATEMHPHSKPPVYTRQTVFRVGAEYGLTGEDVLKRAERFSAGRAA